MATLKIAIKTVSELSTQLAQSIQHRNNREFGNDSLVYAYPEWYILGYISGRLISHVGLLQRTINVGQIPLLTGGVCYLVTEPDSRGKGFASVMIGEALTFLKNELGQSYALLTCRSALESFYAKIGWRTVVGPTVFAQADGVRLCGGLTMVREFGGKAWPEGKIDLCGLPW